MVIIYLFIFAIAFRTLSHMKPWHHILVKSQLSWRRLSRQEATQLGRIPVFLTWSKWVVPMAMSILRLSTEYLLLHSPGQERGTYQILLWLQMLVLRSVISTHAHMSLAKTIHMATANCEGPGESNSICTRKRETRNIGWRVPLTTTLWKPHFWWV